jgi:hypothetical protein
MEKNLDPRPYFLELTVVSKIFLGEKSGSGINILDHISESSETTFRVKIRYLNSLMRMRIRAMGSFKSWIWDGKIRINKHPGAATLQETVFSAQI